MPDAARTIADGERKQDHAQARSERQQGRQSTISPTEDENESTWRMREVTSVLERGFTQPSGLEISTLCRQI